MTIAVSITEIIRAHIKTELARTRIFPSDLTKRTGNPHLGTALNGISSGKLKTIPDDLLSSLFAALEDLPDAPQTSGDVPMRQASSFYIPLTDEMRAELNNEIGRSKANIKRITAPHLTLNAQTVSHWKSGKAKHAKAEEWDWLMNILRSQN